MAVNKPNSNSQARETELAFYQRMDAQKYSKPKEYKKFYEQAYKNFSKAGVQRRASVRAKNRAANEQV